MTQAVSAHFNTCPLNYDNGKIKSTYYTAWTRSTDVTDNTGQQQDWGASAGTQKKNKGK
jgi:hypothetical protein